MACGANTIEQLPPSASLHMRITHAPSPEEMVVCCAPTPSSECRRMPFSNTQLGSANASSLSWYGPASLMTMTESSHVAKSYVAFAVISPSFRPYLHAFEMACRQAGGQRTARSARRARPVRTRARGSA